MTVEPLLPTVVSLGCRITSPKEFGPWHVHPYDELCFVVEDSTCIGHDGELFVAEANSLFLFRRGESHGYWNGPSESPNLWVVHYQASDMFYDPLPRLRGSDIRDRRWLLNSREVAVLKELFAKVSLEVTLAQPGWDVAASAWLQMLLCSIFRLPEAGEVALFAPEKLDSELMDLWQLARLSTGTPLDEIDRLPNLVPNYESLRHRFRKAFGMSPRAMMLQFRIQQAKHLLLDGRLSVKEVSLSVGYSRQHEFTRAFTKVVGMPPTAWMKTLPMPSH